MRLDEEPGHAHRHCRARQWRHLVALPGPVTGIHNDRQVAQPLDGRDDAEIERIARVIGEGPHAALAKDHIVISLAHHIFGGHQKFFQRG